MSDPNPRFLVMGNKGRWHPWRELRDRWPGITANCHHRLTGDVWGETEGDIMRFCASLGQAERRCTLTHELMHLDNDLGSSPAEERQVNILAARKLITLEQLIDAYLWVRHPREAELAEYLWVDVPTLRTRMANLDPIELAELDYRLESDWSWRSA